MISCYDEELFDLVADAQTVRILVCKECQLRFETDVVEPKADKGNWFIHEGRHWARCPKCGRWRKEE